LPRRSGFGIGERNVVARPGSVATSSLPPGAGAPAAAAAMRTRGAETFDAVCAVDILNEGIDVPSIDRVVMLRPTESSVVFLQQLGRGLRADGDKPSLTVIDFVGNHRIFVERLRALLSLAGTDASLRPSVTALARNLTAGFVFVGYGLKDSRYSLDDYRGLDLKGKIAVALQGAPSGLPSVGMNP
jgi:hypothetical protein